jgi:RHS repeat-associated protein
MERIEYAGVNVDSTLVDYKDKYQSSQQTIKDRYAIFEVPYLGKDNDDYVNGQGFCCDDTPQGNALKATRGNDNPELFQYYYHSDHLGSTSLITNLDGEVVQHVEYVPFGEVFIEERNNKWNTPYLFNAKELDEETGLYYYGARYYEPRISVWLSTDLMQEKHPSISSYAYCASNPVKYIDPDGNEWDYTVDANGHTTINVTLNMSMSGNYTADQINAYKSAIAAQFHNTIFESSGGTMSGTITYHEGDPDIKQTLVLGKMNGIIGGMTTKFGSSVNLFNPAGELRSFSDIGLDATHEMLHTLRLEHPFVITQAEDTKLLRVAPNSFISTPTTDKNIANNIMNYSMITFDGLKSSNQTALTKGQLNFMLNEIDLQNQGYGSYKYNPALTHKENMNLHKKYSDDYWNNIPGTPVADK